MLTDYIRAAMRRAKYDKLYGGEGYVGEIDDCPGLLGHGSTLDDCREDLEGALETWIMVGLWHHHPLPVIDGIELTVRAAEETVEAA